MLHMYGILDWKELRMAKKTKPYYEGRGKNIIEKSAVKVSSKKVMPELTKIIKKNNKLERKFRIKRHEASF